MKLKAYSLLELMIAIFLSGIVVSAVYSGYVFTHKQFFKFSSIKTEIRSYFELAEVLNREFETSKKIVKKDDRTIEFEMIGRTINYSFDDNFIVRTFNEKVDTFFFEINGVEINSFEVEEEAFVDHMVLTIKEDQQLSLYKSYGAIVKLEK